MLVYLTAIKRHWVWDMKWEDILISLKWHILHLKKMTWIKIWISVRTKAYQLVHIHDTLSCLQHKCESGSRHFLISQPFISVLHYELEWQLFERLLLKMSSLSHSHCYSLEQSWIYAAVMQLFYIKASIFANHLVTNQNIKPWFSFPISVRASRSPVSHQAISQRVLSSMTLSQGENSHVGACQICSQLKFLPEY